MKFKKASSDFESFIQEIEPPNNDDYLSFIFQFSKEHYTARVEMAGFRGGRKVLDAGCGYGQWALALSGYNKYVIGIDRNQHMIKISNRLMKKFNVINTDFRVGILPDLEFDDEEFDYIWCWSVFMFVEREKTLKEFYRVLKPGGRLLVGCCNSVGRWLYKCFNSLNPSHLDMHTLRYSMNALLKGHRDDIAPHYSTLRSVKKSCEKNGFELIASGFDGYIDLSGRERKLPMFPERFLGFEQNIEFICKKI